MNYLVGAHLSTQGGLAKTLQRAQQLGVNCLQIFAKSPRSWQTPNFDQDLATYEQLKKQLGIKAIFVHASYLINLASAKPDLVKLSVKSLIDDLNFNHLIGGQGVIIHLGSHQGRGWPAVQQSVLANLREIVAATSSDSQLLIENSAGQQGKLSSDLTEIQWLLDQLPANRAGWCFDTCHGFAAGYELAQPKKSDPDQRVWESEVNRLHLDQRLKLIHINDSRGQFNSGLDRHDNLGAGQISALVWQKFLALPLVRLLPLILEVPGWDGHGPDQKNVTQLVNWLTTNES